MTSSGIVNWRRVAIGSANLLSRNSTSDDNNEAAVRRISTYGEPVKAPAPSFSFLPSPPPLPPSLTVIDRDERSS